MSRRIFEQMLEDLELINYSRPCYYQRWNPMQNPVYYSLPDKDFRTPRANRCDFYTTVDYFRQPYYMPSNFVVPGFEPCYFTNLVRRIDKRNVHPKGHQFVKERRNYGERKYYQNRQEREDNSYRVDRGRRNDYVTHFERRYQSSNCEHRDVPGHTYHLSRDSGNSSRLSFRNSSIDFCAEDVMDQHAKHHMKQAFDSRHPSSEYLALKENVLQNGGGVHSDPSMGVNYHDSSAADWTEPGIQNSISHPSDNVPYNSQTDVGNSYESWYCPQEQQQIIDTLKEVNLRHDRQLRRDILAHRGKQLYSDESVSSNHDFHALDNLQNSPSSEDEEIINIMLSPGGASPISEATRDEEAELKSGYLEKSASDFFEEFQNIFTGSPEKQIFNNIIKESLKKTSCIDDEDLEVSGMVITDEDKEAVKSVLTFEDTDEESVHAFSSVTSSSPKEIPSDLSLKQKRHSKSETECRTICENINDTVKKEYEVPKSNSKTILTKHECFDSTNNFSEAVANNASKSDKFQTISKGTSPTNSFKNPCNFVETKKIQSISQNALSYNNFNGKVKQESSPKRNREFHFDSSSKRNDNIEHLSERMNHLDCKQQYEFQSRNMYNSAATNKFHLRNNKNIIFNNSTERYKKTFQNDTSKEKNNCYDAYSQRNYKNSCFYSSNKHSQPNNFTISNDNNNMSFSEPLLPSGNNETVYKRISVSEIFGNSNVATENSPGELRVKQNIVHQFINQSRNQQALSPSAHLKLLLGIGNETVDLNKHKVPEVSENTMDSDDANGTGDHSKMSSDSKIFKQLKSTKKCYSPIQEPEGPTLQKLPCFKAAGSAEIKLTDAMPQSFIKMNAEAPKILNGKDSMHQNRKYGEITVFDSIDRKSDSAFDEQSKMLENKKTSKYNDYHKNQNYGTYSNSYKTSSSPFISSIRQEATQSSIKNNKTYQKENSAVKNAPKLNFTGSDTGRYQNANGMFKIDNQIKKDVDRENCPKLTKTKFLPSDESCNTLETRFSNNEAKVSSENLKSCPDKPNSNRKYKNKKRKEKTFEKMNIAKYGSKMYANQNTEDKKMSKEIDDKKDNSDAFYTNDRKPLSKNTKVEKFKYKKDDFTFTDKPSVNDTETANAGNKFKEASINARNGAFENRQEKPFESNSSISKRNSVQNKFKSFGKKINYSNSNFEALKSKYSNSSEKYETTEMEQKRYVKTRYTRNRYHDSKELSTTEIEQKISSVEMHYDKASYTAAERHISKHSKNSSYDFKKYDMHKKDSGGCFKYKEHFNFHEKRLNDEIFKAPSYKSSNFAEMEKKSQTYEKIENLETSGDEFKLPSTEHKAPSNCIKADQAIINANDTEGRISNDCSKKSICELQKHDRFGSKIKCRDKSNFTTEYENNKILKASYNKIITKSGENANHSKVSEIIEIPKNGEGISAMDNHSSRDITYSRILMAATGNSGLLSNDRKEDGSFDFKKCDRNGRYEGCNIKHKNKPLSANQINTGNCDYFADKMKNFKTTSEVVKNSESFVDKIDICNTNSEILDSFEASEGKKNLDVSAAKFDIPVIEFIKNSGELYTKKATIDITDTGKQKSQYSNNEKSHYLKVHDRYVSNTGLSLKFKDKPNFQEERNHNENSITFIHKIKRLNSTEQIEIYKSFYDKIQNFKIYNTKWPLSVPGRYSRKESDPPLTKTIQNIQKINWHTKQNICNYNISKSNAEIYETSSNCLESLDNTLLVISLVVDLKDIVQKIVGKAINISDFTKTPNSCVGLLKNYKFGINFRKLDNVLSFPNTKNDLVVNYSKKGCFPLCNRSMKGKSNLRSYLLNRSTRCIISCSLKNFYEHATELPRRYPEVSYSKYQSTSIIKSIDLALDPSVFLTKCINGIVCTYCMGMVIICVPSLISPNNICHRSEYNLDSLNALSQFQLQIPLHDVFFEIDPVLFTGDILKFSINNFLLKDLLKVLPLLLSSPVPFSAFRVPWNVKHLAEILDLAYEDNSKQSVKNLEADRNCNTLKCCEISLSCMDKNNPAL